MKRKMNKFTTLVGYQRNKGGTNDFNVYAFEYDFDKSMLKKKLNNLTERYDDNLVIAALKEYIKEIEEA